MRIVVVTLGLMLIVGGAILLVIPGPGLLVIAFGGGLLAQESLWIAKALDRMELALRKLHRSGRRFWKKASSASRAAIAACATLCVGGAAYLAYVWLLGD